MTRTDRIKLAICIGVIVAIPVGLGFFVRWDRKCFEQGRLARENEKQIARLLAEQRSIENGIAIGDVPGGCYVYPVVQGPMSWLVWELSNWAPAHPTWEPNPILSRWIEPACRIDRLIDSKAGQSKGVLNIDNPVCP